MNYKTEWKSNTLNKEFWNEVLVGRNIVSIDFDDRGLSNMTLDSGEVIFMPQNGLPFFIKKMHNLEAECGVVCKSITTDSVGKNVLDQLAKMQNTAFQNQTNGDGGDGCSGGLPSPAMGTVTLPTEDYTLDGPSTFNPEHYNTVTVNTRPSISDLEEFFKDLEP